MSRKTFRKDIVTPELLEKINPDNVKLRDKFLKEKNMRSSDGTIGGYLSDLNIFLVWNLLYNDNKHYTTIKKIEFSEFFSFAVEEMKWGGSRFGRVKSCLSSFSNYIEKFWDEDYPNFRNLVLRAVESMPKEPVREKTVLSEEQIDNLIKVLDEQKEYQMLCWLVLAAASGSRFSELLRFTTDIIDENNTAFDGLFLETTKTIKTKGRTKQGKLLKKYILKDLFLPYYKKWLVERELIMKKNNKEHNSIFVKQDGDPAQATSARIWSEKIEKILGCNFYPHAMRHYFTTHMARLSIPSELIQEIVGWNSEGMVKLYNDMGVKDRKWEQLENIKKHYDNKE